MLISVFENKNQIVGILHIDLFYYSVEYSFAIFIEMEDRCHLCKQTILRCKFKFGSRMLSFFLYRLQWYLCPLFVVARLYNFQQQLHLIFPGNAFLGYGGLDKVHWICAGIPSLHVKTEWQA